MTPARGWDDHEFTPAAGYRFHAVRLGPPGGPEVVRLHGISASHLHRLRFARAREVTPTAG